MFHNEIRDKHIVASIRRRGIGGGVSPGTASAGTRACSARMFDRLYRSLLAERAGAMRVAVSAWWCRTDARIRARPGDPGPRPFRVSCNTAPSLRPAVQAGSKIGNRRGNSAPWCPPPGIFVLACRENLQRPAVSAPPVATPVVQRHGAGRPRHDGCAIFHFPIFRAPASRGSRRWRRNSPRRSRAHARGRWSARDFSFSPFDSGAQD